MRGVLHVHSTFSDGEESLQRIVYALSAAGLDFVLMSDHAEVFDDRRMDEYVALCRALSTSHFLVIPGLEFALTGGTIHILGYGITHRVRAKGMEQLVDGIHSAGGVAVLAHPPTGSINLIGAIKTKLDGIEVWNGRYDGTVAPRSDSFQLLRRIRLLNPRATAYGGVDLHKIAQARKLISVEVDAKNLEREEIIGALTDGRFTIHGGNLAIPSSGQLTFAQELGIAVKQPFCRPWAG
jgi:predicted metal-dependent phosphoesterase TrpH